MENPLFVPNTEQERKNFEALAEYLNNMYFC